MSKEEVVTLSRVRRHLRDLAADPAGDRRAWGRVTTELRLSARRRRNYQVAAGLTFLLTGVAAAFWTHRQAGPRAPVVAGPPGGPRSVATASRSRPQTRSVAAPVATAEVAEGVSDGSVDVGTTAVAFVDSVGVNVRLADYPELFPVVKARLSELGVRHVMDVATSHLDQLAALARQGVRTTLSFPNDSDVHAQVRAQRDWVEAVVIGKRPIPYAAPDFAPRLRRAVARIHDALKQDPETRDLPIVGPTVADEDRRRALGDLSALVDLGGLGNPMNQVPPGGAFLDGLLAVYRPVYGAHTPRVVAQIVYGTFPSDDGVTPIVQAKYVVRAYFENWRRGVVRTLGPQLVDSAAVPTTHFEALGLLTHDGTPKLSFRALQNTLRVLADPGPPFVAPAVPLALEGDTTDVEQVVLHKRDGTMFVALWLAVSSRDADTTQLISFRLPPPYLTVTAHMPLTGESRPLTVSDHGQVILAVPDQVVLVELSR